MKNPSARSSRWLALGVVCLGVLMVVLDMTIVNVALPSVRADLGFSETTLVWVVNAYMLTCGGFLLLGGRLGDLYGQRRLFMIGITLFSAASLACGLAGGQVPLVIARAVQGIGGAIVDAVALALVMNLFTEPTERAKAMGVYGFVCAGGGSIGVLLGGVLTGTYSWHWIFLVNLPIGLAVLGLSLALLPGAGAPTERARLDVAGAVTVTAALMLAVYAIVGGNEAGWTSPRTLGLLAAAAALLAVFIA
ncbi:MAG: MFS transporter, partial [Caldimonas sp.]